MANLPVPSEEVYRVVDAIYRLHRDLFEIERVLIRTARLQLRAARIGNSGRMGALVAGLLGIVPIMIALGDIKWGSAPALTVYAIAAAVVLLWLHQVSSAGDAERDLNTLEGHTSTDTLEDRVDFVLEEVNAAVVRHRLIARIVKELEEAEAAAADGTAQLDLQQKRQRYGEILEGIEAHVQDLIDASAKLVEEKKRDADDHREVLDWAAAIPRFTPADPPDAPPPRAA